ncbi:hypothetical protein ABZ746_32020 [Streptomyces sp. NPDC020096]
MASRPLAWDLREAARLLYTGELSRYACRVCEQRGTEQLRALPSLYAQLELGLVAAAAAIWRVVGK